MKGFDKTGWKSWKKKYVNGLLLAGKPGLGEKRAADLRGRNRRDPRLESGIWTVPLSVELGHL